MVNNTPNLSTNISLIKHVVPVDNSDYSYPIFFYFPEKSVTSTQQLVYHHSIRRRMRHNNIFYFVTFLWVFLLGEKESKSNKWELAAQFTNFVMSFYQTCAKSYKERFNSQGKWVTKDRRSTCQFNAMMASSIVVWNSIHMVRQNCPLPIKCPYWSYSSSVSLHFRVLGQCVVLP